MAFSFGSGVGVSAHPHTRGNDFRLVKAYASRRPSFSRVASTVPVDNGFVCATKSFRVLPFTSPASPVPPVPRHHSEETMGDEMSVEQEAEAILEAETSFGMRVWHLLFLSCGSVLGVVIMLCCCIRFRIPRTKQDIEADYHRKKLTRKFRERLDCMNNADIDEMDLIKALERVREEYAAEQERQQAGKEAAENKDNQAIVTVCDQV